MTFKRVIKKIVTGATRVKAREVYEEEDYQEPRIRRGSRKPPGIYSREQPLPGERLLGTCMGKTASENPPVQLNSLYPEDSVSTDSDEDLDEELDKFFRFMIWNDLSGEEEEEYSSFIQDEEREGSISATDLFAEIADFDDIITDDSDDSEDDGYLPQVSDTRVRFPPFAEEARYAFSLQARPKILRRRLELKSSLE
jgi:hypothetical protein